MADRTADRTVTVGLSRHEAEQVGALVAETGGTPTGIAYVALRLGLAGLTAADINKALEAGEIRAVRRRPWPTAAVPR